jgi:hypothetical protein
LNFICFLSSLLFIISLFTHHLEFYKQPIMSDNEIQQHSSSITTTEGLIEYFMKEMKGLKNQIASINALIAAQSAASNVSLVAQSVATNAPLVAQPLNTNPIQKPTSASRMKQPIVTTILDHLLEDTKFAFTDQALKKAGASHSLTPTERRAFAVYDLLSMWARNITNEELMFVGVSPTFAKLTSAKQQELVHALETCAAKYNLHISRCEDSWMAKALLKEKFSHHADNATRMQKRKKGVVVTPGPDSVDNDNDNDNDDNDNDDNDNDDNDSDNDSDAEEQQRLTGVRVVSRSIRCHAWTLIFYFLLP